jgi:hypothetical protein
VKNQVALTSNGSAWITSAGGALSSAGTTPDDGRLASNNTNFQLFTVAGGQVRAVCSAAGIAPGVNETKIVSVAAVPASSDGTILSQRSFGIGTLSLRGTTSATASGPTSLSRTSTGETVTFSGIKDSAGNTVPNGTLVIGGHEQRLDQCLGRVLERRSGTILDCALTSGNR